MHYLDKLTALHKLALQKDMLESETGQSQSLTQYQIYHGARRQVPSILLNYDMIHSLGLLMQ